MARIPTSSGTPTPQPDGTPEPEAGQIASWDHTIEGEQITVNEDQLRAAAEALGISYDTQSEAEREFLSMYVAGDLASLEPQADPDNPLIPGEASDDAASTPTTTEDGATAPAGDAGVGSDDPEGGGDSPTTVPAAPTQQTEPTVETPPVGSPGFVIPSTLPPPPAPAPEPAPAEMPFIQAPAQPQLVALPNGTLVTLEQYNALVAQQQQSAQFQAPPANPWEAQQQGQYLDERAGTEIQQIMARQQHLEQIQAAAIEQQRAANMQAIDIAVEETKAGYAHARGLTAEQVKSLEDNAVALGIVGMYAQQFPGDPRRAVAAALENVYWQTPEFRDQEIAKAVELKRLENADTDRKKALGGAVQSTTGSVPRTPAKANTREERDKGMVAMIEDALNR